ncbi:MAG: histidine phosphatase family protein, partial [Acidimicrobiales bacterium]
MELLLIRHARPQRAESVDGPADPGLSELGRRQADALAAWLVPEGLDAIYTSPLRRAVQTAAPLGDALGLAVASDAALAEYDADAMAYIPIEELRAAGDPRWMEVPDDIAGFQSRV